jgi:hypothetical protein
MNEKNFLEDKLDRIIVSCTYKLLTTPNFLIDTDCNSEKRNIIRNPLERFYFTEEEETKSGENKFISEVFTGPERMSFNTFPNTYINFTTKPYHRLFIYNKE